MRLCRSRRAGHHRRNPHTHEVMGVFVKSRSRNTGKEGTNLSIPNDNLSKLEVGCQAFACQPYFAIVVDEADSIAVFILSKAHLVRICPPGKKVVSWKMSNHWVTQYETDPEIRSFRLITRTGNWWQ